MKNDYRDIMNEFPLSLYDTDDREITDNLSFIKGSLIRFGELSKETHFIYHNKILKKIDQYNACTVRKRNVSYYLFNPKDLVNQIKWTKNEEESIDQVKIQQPNVNIEKMGLRISLENYSKWTFNYLV